MSSLVVDINSIRDLYKPNHLVKVRILGQILEFNPAGKYFLVKSIILISDDQTTIKLTLEEDMSLSENPELSYPGTLVDCCGLYNGETVMLLSIRVINDPNILYQNRDVLEQISNLKKNPLL